MEKLIKKWEKIADHIDKRWRDGGGKDDFARMESVRLYLCISDLQKYVDKYNNTLDQNERMRKWFKQRTKIETSLLIEQMNHIDFLLESYAEFIDFLLDDCEMDTFDDIEHTLCWNIDGRKYDSKTMFKNFLECKYKLNKGEYI